MVILHFGFWPQEIKKAQKSLKRPKKPKRASRGQMRAINSAFWMELNIILKILVFCIPSFQSSWFLYFAFYGKLNTLLISLGKS